MEFTNGLLRKLIVALNTTEYGEFDKHFPLLPDFREPFGSAGIEESDEDSLLNAFVDDLLRRGLPLESPGFYNYLGESPEPDLLNILGSTAMGQWWISLSQQLDLPGLRRFLSQYSSESVAAFETVERILTAPPIFLGPLAETESNTTAKLLAKRLIGFLERQIQPRHSDPPPEASASEKKPDFTWSDDRRSIWKDGRPIYLNSRAADVMELLLRTPEGCIKEQILEEVSQKADSVRDLFSRREDYKALVVFRDCKYYPNRSS